MIRLFHASDLHFGFEDRKAIVWFRERVEEERPDAVIISGDLTMHAKADEFAAAEAFIVGLPVPVAVQIGNHDLPYTPLRRLTAPYKRFAALAAAIDQPVEIPDLAFVSLKTTARMQWRLNWSKGIIHRHALAETLDSIADERRAGRRVMVVCHHPLVEGDTLMTASTRGGPEALSAIAKAGALAILTGHVHDPFDKRIDTAGGSIRMIGAGTLSERIRAHPPSFNRITIDDQAKIRVVVETPTGLERSSHEIGAESD